MDHSLYSYMGCGGALPRIQKGAEEALEFVKEQAKLCVPVCNLVEQARYGFYASVDPTARTVDVRDDLEYVRIECPHGSGNTAVSGTHGIDISHEDLMRFANSPGDIVSARTLVDLAISAGALKMFVTFDDYYNKQEAALSQFRGVPLVDCASFLEPVREDDLDTSETSVTFPATWKVPHDANLQSIAFCVGVTPKTQSEKANDDDEESFVAAPCLDMPLMSGACAFERGYKIVIGNPGTDDDDEDDSYYVLAVYFNASPNRTRATGGGTAGSTTGYKRVKI
jgi:hypothetical protein